jgi:hypothetical protein
VTPERRIITHYEAYFHDPHSELSRVLGFLDIGASDEVIRRATTVASLNLRHHFTTQHELQRNLPSDVLDLYAQMIEEAGFPFPV